ncbi:hypothetical protein Tco_0378302 [Tanacetum coccineum]
MFESGSYRSHPDHKTLYEALKVYIELENKEEFNEAMAMSRKKRHDDRDPPPPPLKDSERSKKKNHDSDASASKQPPVQKSLAWKTYDIRESPFNPSKQKPASPSEQPVNKYPIPEDVHLLELEDTGAAHLPKIKTRPNWLKPIPEEETPETLEPDWVIPPNDLPETKNNQAGMQLTLYSKKNTPLSTSRGILSKEIEIIRKR